MSRFIYIYIYIYSFPVNQKYLDFILVNGIKINN